MQQVPAICIFDKRGAWPCGMKNTKLRGEYCSLSCVGVVKRVEVVELHILKFVLTKLYQFILLFKTLEITESPKNNRAKCNRIDTRNNYTRWVSKWLLRRTTVVRKRNDLSLLLFEAQLNCFRVDAHLNSSTKQFLAFCCSLKHCWIPYCNIKGL